MVNVSLAIGVQYICNWKFCAQCLPRARQAGSEKMDSDPQGVTTREFLIITL
jgi:hypothetical protein